MAKVRRVKAGSVPEVIASIPDELLGPTRGCRCVHCGTETYQDPSPACRARRDAMYAFLQERGVSWLDYIRERVHRGIGRHDHDDQL